MNDYIIGLYVVETVEDSFTLRIDFKDIQCKWIYFSLSSPPSYFRFFLSRLSMLHYMGFIQMVPLPCQLVTKSSVLNLMCHLVAIKMIMMIMIMIIMRMINENDFFLFQSPCLFFLQQSIFNSTLKVTNNVL